MIDIPIQGLAALKVAILAVLITLGMLWYGLRSETKRPTDHNDDH